MAYFTSGHLFLQMKSTLNIKKYRFNYDLIMICCSEDKNKSVKMTNDNQRIVNQYQSFDPWILTFYSPLFLNSEGKWGEKKQGLIFPFGALVQPKALFVIIFLQQMWSTDNYFAVSQWMNTSWWKECISIDSTVDR